jgi:hypothetical protein
MQTLVAAQQLQRSLVDLTKRWNDLTSRAAPALNKQLKEANLSPLSMEDLKRGNASDQLPHFEIQGMDNDLD